jgi:hypothetical protein
MESSESNFEINIHDILVIPLLEMIYVLYVQLGVHE